MIHNFKRELKNGAPAAMTPPIGSHGLIQRLNSRTAVHSSPAGADSGKTIEQKTADPAGAVSRDFGCPL